MAQRNWTTLAGGVVLGVLGAMAVGAFGVPFFGGRDTRVTLATELIDEKEVCKLGKETTVKAKAGEDLTWKIENYCLEEATVSVGDFRLAATPTVSNCSVPGGAYPFQSGTPTVTVERGQENASGRIRPGKGEIKLKVKDHNEPTEAMITYYFNICLGNTSVDPRLLVER